MRPAFMLTSSEVVLFVVYSVESREDSNGDGGIVTLIVVTIDIQGSGARHRRVVKGFVVASALQDSSSNDKRPFLLVECEVFDDIDVLWTLDKIERGVTMLITLC